MSKTRLALIAVTAALVVACKSAGAPTPSPEVRFVYPPPCLMAPPVRPGPVLSSIPPCEGDVEGTCPALSTLQIDALWTYVEALEAYARRAFRACGPNDYGPPQRGDRRAAGGGGAGDGSAAP